MQAQCRLFRLELRARFTRRRLGLNAVRIRASPTAYLEGPTEFGANLAAYIEIIRPLGIRVLPVLFDTGDISSNRARNTTLLQGYFGTVVQQYADDGAVIGFDVCNECYFTGPDKPAALAVLARLVAVIRAAAPQKVVTTGMGDYGLWPGEIEQVQWVNVVSFHSYNGNQTDMRAQVRRLKEVAARAGKQVGFASEVMNRPWDPICGDISVLAAERLGWFAWELMVSESGWGVPKCPGCPIYQGLLWPNATPFNTEEVACIRDAATAATMPTAAPAVAWLAVSDAIAQGALLPSPAGRWAVESGGSNFLPWKTQPWRGQGSINATAVGSRLTLLAPCGTKAAVVYFSTAVDGGVLEVAASLGAPARCFSLASPTPTHANRLTLASAGLACTAEARQVPINITIVSAGFVRISGFDLWTALPGGPGLPPAVTGGCAHYNLHPTDGARGAM